MNHITFKDKEGFDINVLAFDGESNFAILDRTSTGSPTPYVVVKGLDVELASWSYSEGYFDNYDDCVRKYKSSVLEHTKSDIPMKAMFAYLLRRDIEPMLTRTLTDDEVWQAFDSFMQNDDFASLLDREIVPMALDIIEENERRENLKIQDIIDAPLKWDSKTKPDGVFIGMTVSDFVFSHGLYQNMKLNDFNELLAKEGFSTFPNKQYPFTNLERMISDEEFKLDVLNISDNLNKIYDETDFVYSPWSEKSINTILRIGSGFVNGKYRIYHLYTAMNVNAKDKAIFLKNEYGIGGQTYDFKNKNQDKGSIDHDSKGLTVSVYSKDSASLFRDSESKTFSWADVSSRIERLIATGKYLSDEEMEHYNSMNKDEILPAWLLEKCGLSDYTKNSQVVERPDWMEKYEVLIDRDNDYVLLRDPNENVNSKVVVEDDLEEEKSESGMEL